MLNGLFSSRFSSSVAPACVFAFGQEPRGQKSSGQKSSGQRLNKKSLKGPRPEGLRPEGPWPGGLLSLLAFGLIAAVLVGCDSNTTGGMEEDPTPGPQPPGNTNSAPNAVLTLEASEPEVGTEVRLDGTGSSDPDGDDLTYDWTIAGPDGNETTIEEGGADRSTFTPQKPGEHEVTLEVSDGDTTDTDEGAVQAIRKTVFVRTVLGDDDITEDRTLVDSVQYRVSNDITVEGTGSLTIEPGVELFFEQGISVEILDDGVFRANGTGEDPIVMSAADGNEEAGSWRGIFAQAGPIEDMPTVSLDHVHVRYPADGLVADTPGSLSDYPSQDDSTRVRVTNSTFSEIRDFGIRVGRAVSSVEEISGNQFRQIGDEFPVIVDVGDADALSGGNEFESEDKVELRSLFPFPKEVSIPSIDVPYFIRNDIAFSGDLFQVEEGTDILFGEDTEMELKASSIRMKGTEEEPITLTAKSENAGRGWWRGVLVGTEDPLERRVGEAIFQHVTVRGAGEAINSSEQGANIRFIQTNSDASLRVENSTIAESAGDGIFCRLVEGLTVENNTFSEIAGENVNGCN